jgi:hypothetical protein
MSASAVTLARRPSDRASALDVTSAEFDLMTMDERLEFVRAMRRGPARRLGAGERWRNIEGVIMFFRDHRMGAPGTWVSHVNAGVLEGIERGLAIALGNTDGDFGNPGSAEWARYIARLSSGELTTKGAHDTAWSKAKEAGTDYGVALAEQVHGLKPTGAERRFLLFAQFYNWALGNRPALDLMVAYAGVLDPRLRGLRPEFLDWFINVGSAEAARRGCEIAHSIAHVEPSPQALSAVLPLLSELPRLFDAPLTRDDNDC